ncbi:DUF1178 family protein [Sphingomonas sp. GV3]|uniref:DUF1178 family protein n=1 Tax=Sphingomonas sp. GV3 TaxID=3040671 RepID=UPI00280C17A9|nr:DUF1178 family protein [Sphingomonas sp. GV3]
MIVFDLRCASGHVFEAWFGSSDAYADQRAAGQVACPLCGDVAVDKAVMAPNIPAKMNSRPEPAARGAEAVKGLLRDLAQAQAQLLSTSTWVGADFADRARAMHDGDEPHATIHGQASAGEAKALIDDGVAVMPLPFPVIPPETAN